MSWLKSVAGLSDLSAFTLSTEREEEPMNIDHHDMNHQYSCFSFSRVAERLHNFVAVHVPCTYDIDQILDEESDLIVCGGKYQAWGIIVGNKDLHGSFENFRETVQELEFRTSHKRRCISAQLLDKENVLVENSLCEDFGNIHRVLIASVFLLFITVLSCIGIGKFVNSKIAENRRKQEEELELQLSGTEDISL